jgi:hypothetical protein
MGLKFVDVVRFRNQLDDLNLAGGQGAIDWANGVSHAIETSGINLYGHNRRVPRQRQRLQDSIGAFVNQIEIMKQNLDTWIRREESELLQQSVHELYREFQDTSAGKILQRKLSVDDDNLFSQRIQALSDWKVPGMIIRPGIEDHVTKMVALDPLYVIDHNWNLVEPAMSRFTEQYRSRLRSYLISDSATEIFSELPKNQFGLIVSYNFLNYKPLPLIERYLRECFSLLRPGGSLVFTFNDCDRAHGVALFEAAVACYTPGSQIRAAAIAIGYHIINDQRESGDLCWLELCRPGEMRSIRGAQTLAKIVERSK